MWDKQERKENWVLSKESSVKQKLNSFSCTKTVLCVHFLATVNKISQNFAFIFFCQCFHTQTNVDATFCFWTFSVFLLFLFWFGSCESLNQTKVLHRLCLSVENFRLRSELSWPGHHASISRLVLLLFTFRKQQLLSRSEHLPHFITYLSWNLSVWLHITNTENIWFFLPLSQKWHFHSL